MIGIYKITNLATGKIYVGQSSNIKDRWRAHRARYKNPKSIGYDSQLYKDMRIYGLENFEFSVVEECKSDELLDREKYWVKKLDSYEHGYNETEGGRSGVVNKIPKDMLHQIIEELRTTTDGNIQIAKRYNVSENMISGINTGYYWPQDDIEYPIRKHIPKAKEKKVKSESSNNRKVKERPSPEELSVLIIKNGFEGTGRLYGVAGSSIRKWCSAYNMPTHISEYKPKNN